MSIEQTTNVMSRPTAPSRPGTSPPVSSGEGVQSPRQEAAVVTSSFVPPVKISDEGSQAEEQAKINQAVSEINDFVQNIQRSVHFSVDDDSGKTIVRVIDRETNELIRQIPTEEILHIARALEEQIATNKSEGLILQVRA